MYVTFIFVRDIEFLYVIMFKNRIPGVSPYIFPLAYGLIILFFFSL